MLDAGTLDETRAACRAALEDAEDLRPLWRASQDGRRAAPLEKARALLPAIRTFGTAAPRLAALKQALARDGYPVGGGAFERFLIVSAAHDAVDHVNALPVDARVKELFCQNFNMYAAGKTPEPFDVARTSFVAMGRLATLSRFPAGQLDWEVSGVPRSWLLKVPWTSLPRFVAAVMFQLRGFGPAYFSHVNPNRRNQSVLLERESLRSYYRMARSLERQPEIKGLVTASWLHSSDTFVVSPHLKWLNEVFLQNGGHVLPLGPAERDSGVLYRSPERQQAFEAGTFQPTEALVIWPRQAMLAWAAGHEELREDRVARRPVLMAQDAPA